MMRKTFNNNSHRLLRVNELIKREISIFLQGMEWTDYGLEGLNLTLTDVECSKDIRIAKIFYIPEGIKNSVDVAVKAAKFKVVDVIGTTGFSKSQLKQIEKASKNTTLIKAGNMSLGVNILTGVTEKIAEALDDDFDIEIVEMHHNKKIDAPSGTALMLGDAVANAKSQTLDSLKDGQRDGIIGPRKKGKIGFSVIRGGDIVGNHSVIFAGQGEQITITHNATDRMIFARGAIKAAKWGMTAPNGEYSMKDVLKLN